MKTKLILFTLIWINIIEVYSQPIFSSYEQAKLHPIIHVGPAPDFFEGALIGNGGLGAVVCSRPDAIMIRFGHNNVWDIRIAENNRDELGTFREIFDKVKEIDPDLQLLQENPWYAGYMRMAVENYRKPYPRPFPCGSLILGFDRRNVEVIDHKLDISNGLVTVKLLLDHKSYAYLQIFADMTFDRIWMNLVDDDGRQVANCFNRIRLIPDPSTPEEFPKYEVLHAKNGISFKQTMPYLEPEKYDKEKGHEKDKAFSLSAVSGNKLEKKQRIDWHGNLIGMADLEYAITKDQPFWLCIELKEGFASNIDISFSELEAVKEPDFEKAFLKTNQVWKDYWNSSGVILEDEFLESTWYRNLYFLNCATKAGVNCPGLFANWSFQNIGTAWHGDYHMNYNTQQPFWATFSSNHLENNLPYVEMIEFISEVAKKWAEEYYGMHGAYYPHSAYPVEMTMNPYPVPTWGWEICETPWSVQGVWWHYLYSGDKEFLESRAFPLIKDATLFIVDYMTRPDAHGPQWGDNKYHVFPTVPPELYGLRPGFRFNSDCLVDLTLIKFLFKSYLNSVNILGYEKNEKETVVKVQDILDNYPEYPVEESDEFGKVFVSVSGESTETVYNVPNSLMTAFPGEDHGLHSDEEILEILSNTKNNLQIEGGNELVFQHMQAARIGMLNLEAFKREIQYNLLPNGTCSNNTLQIHGRYNDLTDPYYMADMGIWYENFGLPAVINECLMQSYNGIIRLFPNWPENKDAEFKTLRATGGFLISSSILDGRVQYLSIFSEHDNEVKLYNPWDPQIKLNVTKGDSQEITEGEIIEINIKKGQSLLIQPIENK